jgi:hypothetical protein
LQYLFKGFGTLLLDHWNFLKLDATDDLGSNGCQFLMLRMFCQPFFPILMVSVVALPLMKRCIC